MRHGDHGKVLDGIELRLDQERDAKPHARLDDRPDGTEHRFDGEHQPRLIGAESEALIDRIEGALDEVHRPPEDVHDPREQSDDHVQVKLVKRPPRGLDDLLLEVAAGAGVEEHRAGGEHQRGNPRRAAGKPASVPRHQQPGHERDHQRAAGMVHQPAHGAAAEKLLDRRQPEKPPRECDQDEMRDGGRPAARLPRGRADGRQVEQRPECDPDREHAAAGVHMPHLTERVFRDRLDDVLEAPEDDPGTTEGEQDVRGEEPAGRHAKERCADPLHQREIERRGAIDAVERRGQPVVELQQLVAGQPLRRSLKIGQLELVAGDGVADAAKRDETPLHDHVE